MRSVLLSPQVPARRGFGGIPFRVGVFLLGVLLAPGLVVQVAAAQEPPPPPPLPDTLPITPPPPGDTIPVADTIPAAEDPGAEVVPARQILPRNVPLPRPDPEAGVERGVWAWDREALLATSALTLHDLLSFVPGVILVRGGDLGTPVALSAFGAGAGHVRVFLDGVEDAPLEGGVIDLSQVGLTGLEEVRLERGPAELRVHLTTHQVDDPRPLTTLEVGTGDFRTNLFRVGFVHPNALGGTLLVALDRADTDGPRREEPGAVFGTRFRYGLFPREGMGLALEYRSRTARRPEETYAPREVDRSEWSLRGGWEVSSALTAEVHAVRARATLGQRSAPTADSLLPAQARSTLGGRLTWVPADGLRGWVAASGHAGEGWPRYRIELGASGSREGLGGVALRLDREGWSEAARMGRDSDLPAAERDAGESASLRVWSAPRAGVSLFAEAERSHRGVPFVVPPDRLPPPAEGGVGTGAPDGNGSGQDHGNGDPGTETGNGEEGRTEPVPFDPVRFVERDGVRAGARLAWRGADMSAAWFRVESDLLVPFGLPFDREGQILPGGIRQGFEVAGHLPLDRIRRGLTLAGTGQFWDAGSAGGGWRYLPERSWTGELRWYHEGYDGRLEVWADLGVRGRDAMSVPLLAGMSTEEGSPPVLDVAPFTQSWFARLQFRVVTVRVFVHWENLAFRTDNADLPGRFQPQTRAMYGVRWTMWN